MSIADLMQAIVTFDCQPSVFRVSLDKSDHQSGFDATVVFRSTHPGALRSISAHADDSQKALETILSQLQERWGKCSHCGAYQRESIV